MIRPVFDVSFTKFLGSLLSSDSLTIHRKHLLLRLRPQASFAICSSLTAARLPNETYTTDPGSFESSHFMQTSELGLKRFKP